MNYDDYSYSVKNLKLYQYTTPNKKLLINPESPFSTGKLSTNYSNKYTSKKYIFKNIYKTFHKDIDIKNNHYSLITNPNCSSKITNKFIIKSLKKEKKKKIKPLISLIKTPKKKIINKNNFIFIPKKDEIQNLHLNLMKKNKISVKLNQEKELQNIIFNNNKKELEQEKIKNNNISLTKENFPLFVKQYNFLINDRKKEKKLILKEINNIGKKLYFSNVKNLNDLRKENDINNTLYAKRVKEKECLLEINQIANLPAISQDKNLVLNLWQNDMRKFCKLTMNSKNKNNYNFIKNLLCIYS